MCREPAKVGSRENTCARARQLREGTATRRAAEEGIATRARQTMPSMQHKTPRGCWGHETCARSWHRLKSSSRMRAALADPAPQDVWAALCLSPRTPICGPPLWTHAWARAGGPLHGLLSHHGPTQAPRGRSGHRFCNLTHFLARVAWCRCYIRARSATCGGSAPGSSAQRSEQGDEEDWPQVLGRPPDDLSGRSRPHRARSWTGVGATGAC